MNPTVKVQYGCGHEREIETPGEEDPQGLLAGLAARGAVHRVTTPCPICTDAGIVHPAPAGSEHSPSPAGEPLPGGAGLDAYEADLYDIPQETQAIHPFDWRRLVEKAAPPPLLLDEENAIYDFHGWRYRVTTDVPSSEIAGLQTGANSGDASDPGKPAPGHRAKAAAKKV